MGLGDWLHMDSEGGSGVRGDTGCSNLGDVQIFSAFLSDIPSSRSYSMIPINTGDFPGPFFSFSTLSSLSLLD